MAFVYQLPWRSEGSHSIARTLINDWQINGIVAMFSGTPFTVTADGTTLNTPGNTQTADLVGTVTKIGEIGAAGYYFDPAAWAQPEGVRFGTSRINQFRGPGGIESRPLGLPFVLAGRDASNRGPGRSDQRHQYVQVRQPDGQSHERRLHAHFRVLQQRVRGTSDPVWRSLQLLGIP